MSGFGSIVGVNWLREHLNDENVVVVDATVHLPDTGRDAMTEYRAAHIPGAIFFDLAKIADPDNPLPRKVPGREHFAREVGAIGIGNNTKVIAYDTPGLYSAARVWWLFRLYGYDNVAVLDGGLKAWVAAGEPTEAGEVVRPPRTFVPPAQRDILALWPSVLEASRSNRQILDARTKGRWAGTETDRYPGARPGHIPGSANLYWADLLEPETRRLLPDAQLRARFEAAGFDLRSEAILSCGSGLTACILALALSRLGHDNWRVYDGSWDEWGRNPNLPVETA
ncbi:MAG TPA: sulfurtransferase [Xanthobacteraceae bacterium]|nr:sulfurtransferase [Xanthobacteraceae bacterium]